MKKNGKCDLLLTRTGKGNVRCTTIESAYDSTNTVGFGGNAGFGVTGCPQG